MRQLDPVQVRLDMALRGGVPAGAQATDLDDFIRVVRAEEDRLAPPERGDVRLTITKLRKLFYGGSGWDEHLIPGAAPVAPLYEFCESGSLRREFEAPGPNVIDFVDRRARLAGAGSQLAVPGDLQEVLMPDGELVDVGHVLAGLDALNHPSAVAPFGLYEMTRNVDAVTWAGDLGSVVAEAHFQAARLDRPLTAAELQTQIDGYAPPQDMLGNADAYAIGAAFDIASRGADRRVTELLLEFYGPSPDGAAARSRRFTTFALAIGLGELRGGAFAGEELWLTRHEREIGHAAALYVGATGEAAPWGLTYSIGAKLALMDTVRDSWLRRPLLRTFLAALKAEVAGEPAGASG